MVALLDIERRQHLSTSTFISSHCNRRLPNHICPVLIQ